MKVLLTGANGFVGRHIMTFLIEAGHNVSAAVRDPVAFRLQWPSVDAIACDFMRDGDKQVWIGRLAGFDAVINCAGVLQRSPGVDPELIHHLGPAALFDACSDLGLRKVIQISAISARPGVDTEYAQTKCRGDTHLMGLDLDWVVLKPSLLYAKGSYGGTSLIRALAAIPFVLPLPGSGDQLFQPIHLDDFGRTVIRVLEEPEFATSILEPAGPENLSLKDILLQYRAWLGIPSTACIEIPLPFVKLACRIGDLSGVSALRTTSLDQILQGNCGDNEGYAKAMEFEARTLAESLQREPSDVQDRWHAQLYFAAAMTTLVLAITWIVSGSVGLWVLPDVGQKIAGRLGLSGGVADIAAAGSCLMDIAVGLWVASRRATGLCALVQTAIILTYTLLLGIAIPELWSDPFGPLIKNLPMLALIPIWAVLAKSR
ncbi:SDR family oxidoreductase [Pelagibius sp. Alg239-R121]|uniref:SDR family oxidoreductase n=1 Tax=Pelagibius sp. Alg239-R121 TaxID=2993448 RepID=UPI0024A7A18C|nr:SDR family oxidoreductase [Pelagibius sp. Alg239-R121]